MIVTFHLFIENIVGKFWATFKNKTWYHRDSNKKFSESLVQVAKQSSAEVWVRVWTRLWKGDFPRVQKTHSNKSYGLEFVS